MSPDRFEVDDVVRIREWDDMESEFGLSSNGNIKCKCYFTTGMRQSCGKLCTISKKDDRYVELVFEDPRIAREMCRFSFSTDMIEPVEHIDMSQEAVRSVSDFLSEM